MAFAVFTGKTLLAQQTPQGLSITPSSMELSISPGQTLTRTITLGNFTDQTVDVAISRRNFTANGEEGQVNLTEEETGFSLAAWIKTNPEKVTLSPNEKAEFEIAITVPTNAEPGGHFGSVVFGTIPSKTLNQTGAVVSQEVAALILIKVPGEVTENAKIESFTTEKKFYENGPVIFNTRVKNESTVHIKPAGTVTVTDMFGRKFTTQVEGNNILPQAIRKLNATLKNRFLIGNYSAKIELAYGTQNNALLVAETSFVAFPVKMGIVVLVVLFILFAMRRRLWKALNTILTGK